MSQNDAAVQALNAAEQNVVNAIITAVTAMNGATSTIDTEKQTISDQAAQIAALQEQINQGGPITAADLQPVIDALNGSVTNLGGASTALSAAIPTPASISGAPAAAPDNAPAEAGPTGPSEAEVKQ